MKLACLRRWRRPALEVALLLGVFLGVQALQSRHVLRGAAPALAGRGLDGEALSLAALQRGPALLHFWATWCGVCRAEEANIVALARDVPLLTVASSSGDAAQVKAYLDARGVHGLPVIVDPDGRIAAAFGIGAFPTDVIVDGKGQIASVAVGYSTKLGLRARLWAAR